MQFGIIDYGEATPSAIEWASRFPFQPTRTVFDVPSALLEHNFIAITKT